MRAGAALRPRRAGQLHRGPSRQPHDFAYPSIVAPYKVSVTDARGKLWQHESDSRLRPTKRTDPLGTVTQYAYDGDSNLAQITEAAGTTDEATTKMT